MFIKTKNRDAKSKGKNNKQMTHIKLKSSAQQRKPSAEWNGNLQNEKIFVNHGSVEEYLIYKNNLYNPVAKKKN